LFEKMKEKIEKRKAVVGVIGLGYVGLPLAVEYGDQGFKVLGFDINKKKVDLINSGRSDIDDIADVQVRKLVQKGLLKATLNFALLKNADCISICVPTPLSKTKDPDVSYILSAVNQVRKYLHS
jgi:UDP-N-acetyl-D-glucosamine dehydrogenase